MTGARRRVLVVDDDDDFRSSVVMLLADDGWDVREARHGLEALELLETFEPSVMMLDWRMPVMDGEQVLQHLGGHPRRPRIVLVTASSQAQDLASRHGLRYHVGKPFEISDLLAVLEDAHREHDQTPSPRVDDVRGT